MIARLRAWSILIVMGMGWGLTFSLGRIAAVGGAHPLSITFWEAATAAVLLVASSLVRGRTIPLSRELILLYLAAGILGIVAPGVIFFYAAAHAPAGILSITVAIVPILTFLASALVGLEVLALGRVAGVCLGTAAIILLVGPQESLPDPAQLAWVLLCLLTPICYTALNMILALWVPRGATPFTTTAGMFVASALIMIPILYASGTFDPLGWPLTTVEWSMLGLGFISATAFSIYFHLIDTAGPGHAVRSPMGHRDLRRAELGLGLVVACDDDGCPDAGCAERKAGGRGVKNEGAPCAPSKPGAFRR